MPWLSGLQGQCLCTEKQRSRGGTPLAGACIVGQRQAPWDPLEGTFLPGTVPAWSCLSLGVPGTPSLHTGSLEDGGVIAPEWGPICGPGAGRQMSSLLSRGRTSEGCSAPKL